MKKLKIVFFGTPEFAVYCLDYLIMRHYAIVGVVTSPDKPAGRGKKTRQSVVKQYCIKHQLNLFQPENLKDKDFVNAIRALAPSIQIVVAFRMLPKVVWSIPIFGTINLHASLLPNYRGAAPINWAIINGEEKTGVTTFIINEEIDTGNILLQQEITISSTETALSLHDRLLGIGAPLIAQTIDGMENRSLEPQRQILTGKEPLAPKLNSENTAIDCNQPLVEIEAKIRGLSPHPGAWVLFTNNNQIKRMKIFKAIPLFSNHSLEPKKIIVNDHKILIATKEGYLQIEVIQLENKKQMDSKALLNGYKFDTEARVL